jgi:hypothetical protein
MLSIFRRGAKDSPSLPALPSGPASPPATVPRPALPAQAGSRVPLPPLAAAVKPCVAIALDATASMTGPIDEARQSIDRILDGIYAEAKVKVRARVYVYRDYDVRQGVCESSDLSGNSQTLSRWLATVKAHGGGGNQGEAVETALEAIYEQDEVSVVVLAGDEPSNSRAALNSYNMRRKLSAREWAAKFAQRTVPIHTFRIGGRSDTEADFAAIAKLSGGQSGMLDGSDAMIHMAIMAVLRRINDVRAVERYVETNRLSIAARDFSQKLIGAAG